MAKKGSPEEDNSGRREEEDDVPMLEEISIDCKLKGKKRKLKVAQMNIMLFDEKGQKPVASWLLEKIEGWEYDKKKQTLALQVREGDSSAMYALKMSDDDGETALAAIQKSVDGLVAERKRLKKAAAAVAKQQSETGAGPQEGKGPEGPGSRSPKRMDSMGSDEVEAAAAMVSDKMFDCKLKGKKRKLKVAQMNIMLFDEKGQKPVASWLLEKIEGWEYDKKKELLSLWVLVGETSELHALKMGEEVRHTKHTH